MDEESDKPKIWRLVLTGGPCAGKTTALSRLSTFFENIGWKVYRVPESANILLSGGVNFSELSPEQTEKFQENLLKTILQIENTYFDLAEESKRNCLVICDRGTMDASAYISPEKWNKILARNSLDEVEIRDNRYDQVETGVPELIQGKGYHCQYYIHNRLIFDQALNNIRSYIW